MGPDERAAADRHLDDAELQLLAASDPAAMAHFRRHLKQTCESCEAYLRASPRQLWWLDAEADRLLFMRQPGVSSSASTHGFAGVQRALRRKRMRAAGFALAGLAIAASLAFLVVPLVIPGGRPPAWDGVKGAEAATLELSAAVAASDGALTPLPFGGTASPSQTVVLRYRASRAGRAYLLKALPAGTVRALGAFQLEAGTHDLTSDGALAGVSLEGERGEVTLFLVQSDRPLSAEELTLAVQHPPLEGATATGRFSLRVGSAEN